MFSNIHKILIVSLLSIAFAGCVKEDLVQSEVFGETVLVDFDFGHNNFEEIKITTRATLDIVPESRLSNMFVFIFSGGKRYYAHYFDASSLKPAIQDVKGSDTNCWFVDQKTSETDAPTHGTVRIKAPAMTAGKMYVVANINSDMVNISPEQLNMITTEQQLKDLAARLNQEITSRNGFFPMTGQETVDINSKGIFKSGTTTGTCKVMLDRLDAKVRFNIKVANGFQSQEQIAGQTTTQRLKEFRPTSWRVVNLPKGTFVVPSAGDYDAGFFSTPEVSFETADAMGHGFSFYMLENREAQKAHATTYHERDRRNKDPQTGKFDNTNGMWLNAPENGTYVEIKGEVLMDVDVSSEAKTQQLTADVTYYIHLGDFKKSPNNYDVLRNTFYDYTITIKGVKNIELEVVTSKDPTKPGNVQENQPGAEGHVYVAKESIHTFDAHYGQRVFSFDADLIDPSTVTWYVKTPFGKEGTPDIVAGTEVPSGMDYKWVHFLVNDVATDNTYSKNNMTWPGHPEDNFVSDAETALWQSGRKVMDIVAFTKYIKAQATAYKEGRTNDFRREFDQQWLDWWNKNHPNAQVTDPNSDPNGVWFRNRIYVTIFVDEFYYESDPISGEVSQTLWKRFVNQPNRLMHVLCDNEKSLDGASSTTGSVVTIRQKSIQTPYSLGGTCKSAWGCEVDDENADSYFFFTPSESTFADGVNNPNVGSTSLHNGLYNTVRLWGCQNGNTWNTMRWSVFADYNRPNDFVAASGSAQGRIINFLKEDHACYQYSAVTRNRDNNGNGVIDKEEVRWYLASLGQLQFLYMGEQGLSPEAVTYPRKYSTAQGNYADGPYAGKPKWKCHLISSTNNGQHQQVLWAEEGLSVSGYKISWEQSPYAVKCVRNLGFAPADFNSDDQNHRPEPLVKEHKPTTAIGINSEYRFDFTNINDKSKRFYTSVELEPYDENSEMARLYEGLTTGPLVPYSPASSKFDSYTAMKNLLSGGQSPCPAGYRVPNIREAGIMFLLCDNEVWWNNQWIYTSSYYSLGYYGNKLLSGNGNVNESWTIKRFGGGNINVGYADVPRHVRCVKDWDPVAYPIK